MIDHLSLDEQADSSDIVRRRQIEQRREEIAVNIARSHQEYRQDKVFRGTIDEVIAELNE